MASEEYVFSLRPHLAGEFWKRIFIFVQTNPSRKESFSETVFKPEEFENIGFAFSCGQKTFWKWKWWRCDFSE